MVVIGGGVIGLELGSVWRRLGAKVTVVEFVDQILPGFDGEVRRESAKLFKKQGMELKLSTKVTGVTVADGVATVTVEPAAGGASETLTADAVLVSIGRKANVDGLNLEAIGLDLNKRGQIETDHSFRTKVDGVWAIGDCVPGLMLAHKAEDEGVAVAENIAGQTGIVNEDVIPSVVYTMPEIAGVGLTEEAAKRQDRDQGRQVPVRRQQPRQDQPRHRRFREGHRRRQDRPRPGRLDRLEPRGHADRRSRHRDGIRRDQRGHRLHLSCASDACRGDEGSRDGGARQAYPYLAAG